VAAVEERLAAPASGEEGRGVGGGSSSSSSSSNAGSPQAAAAAEPAPGGGGDPLLVDGPLQVGGVMAVAEASGVEVVVRHVEGAPRNMFERADAALFAARAWVGRALARR
jgi:hypothetical protein